VEESKANQRKEHNVEKYTLFSKNSNLCDHDTSTLRTDRRMDRQFAVAIGEISYQRCRLKS